VARRTVRIYFVIGRERRSFYWLSIGSDKSIYFSSSDSKNYTRGFTGQSHVPIEGARVTPQVSGRPMTKEEIEGYHSLHASGVLNLPIRCGGRRERRVTRRISESSGPVPLAGLMPMEVNRYPIATRTLTAQDITVESSSLVSQPFALLLYAKRPTDAHPKATEQHNDWDIYARYCSTVCDVDVCAIVYANTKTFRRWPELEIAITGHPSNPGDDMPWPIFAEH
jgi:hypothetical protein